MDSRTQFEEQQDPLKVELIQANLETAVDFAKLALYSDDEREVVRYRQKAYDAYEEALHSLRTAALTHVEGRQSRRRWNIWGPYWWCQTEPLKRERHASETVMFQLVHPFGMIKLM